MAELIQNPLCRCCLNENKDSTQFLEMKSEVFSHNEQNVGIYEIYCEISGFSAEKFPNLVVADTKICDLCLMQLQIAYAFRETSSNSSQKLEQQLASIYKTMIVENDIATTSTENYYESRIDDYVEPITDIRPLPTVSFEPFINSNLTMNRLHVATTTLEMEDDEDDDDCVLVEPNVQSDLCLAIEGPSNSQAAFIALSNSTDDLVPESSYMIDSNPSIQILQTTHEQYSPYEYNLETNATIQHEESVCPDTSNQLVKQGFYLNSTSLIPETVTGSRLISIRKLDNTVPAELEPQESWNISTIKKCGICCVFFKTDSEFLDHQLKEHPLPRFKCNLCPKVFRLMNSLCNHKKFCHALSVRTCGRCPATFNSYEEFKKHKSLHSNDCSECNLRFSNYRNLKRHIARHKPKTTPFVCEICNQTFALAGTLYAHKQIEHQIYECRHCLLVFKSKDEAALHSKVKHPATEKKAMVKEYDCKICLQICSSPSALRKHNSQCHHHECGKCRAVFISYSLLRSHKASQHAAPAYRHEINNEKYESEEEEETEIFEIEEGEWLKSES